MRCAPVALLVPLLGTPLACSRPAVPSPSNSTQVIPAGAVDLTDRRGPGTHRMAERLKSFYETVRVEDDVFMNAERAEMFRKRLETASDAKQILHLWLHVAQELLKAGLSKRSRRLREAWLGKGGHLPLSLLRNNCDGTFEDVTEQAGLLRFHPTQTAVWFDYNNDGWLDLFVGNESVDDGIQLELQRWASSRQS
jgi:hypothetical protein